MTQIQNRPDRTPGQAALEPAAVKVRLAALAGNINWWLWLIPIFVVAGWAAFANAWGDPAGIKGPLENAAVVLVSAATAIFVVRTVVTRSPLHLLVTVMAANLLCREIHFAGTTAAVYVVSGLVAVWAVLWRRRILAWAGDGRFLSWLLAAMWAYVLSQLVARRVFSERHLALIPNEDAIHVSLEEIAETAAHLMLIVSALVGNWKRRAMPGGDA